MLSRRRLLRTLPLAALAGTSCEPVEPPTRYRLPEHPLDIVTSTVQAADLIRRIGGEAVTVRSLIPPETNPHLWKPTASDIATARIADAFFLSGLGLEAGFKENLQTLREAGLHVGVLANGLEDDDILKDAAGKPDPHFWMDPRLWGKAALEAAHVLGEAAPPAATWFKDRSHEYKTELEYLRESSLRQLSQLQPRHRFLLSSHASLAYFGSAFDLETRSFANAMGEAAAAVPADLKTWIEEHNIRTLFRESFTDARLLTDTAHSLLLNADLQIFSLSLANTGTRLPGLSSALEVDTLRSALQFTVETVMSRLMIE